MCVHREVKSLWCKACAFRLLTLSQPRPASSVFICLLSSNYVEVHLWVYLQLLTSPGGHFGPLPPQRLRGISVTGFPSPCRSSLRWCPGLHTVDAAATWLAQSLGPAVWPLDSFPKRNGKGFQKHCKMTRKGSHQPVSLADAEKGEYFFLERTCQDLSLSTLM